MEPKDQESIFRPYAWDYFVFHADQRMKTFNFFLVVAGLLAGGITGLMKEVSRPCTLSPLGLILASLAIVFWRMDQRNHQLVKTGETALRYLDGLHALPMENGRPHPLCLIARDEADSKGKGQSLWRKGYHSYTKLFRCIFLLFFSIGIYLAALPFLIAKDDRTKVSPPQAAATPSAPTPRDAKETSR